MDYAKLISGILKRTSDYCGLNALRIYWYDASKDALFTDQHKKIALLPDVKVRLGRVSFNGDQKGVDLKLGIDLIGIARNKAASIAFLVSGDDDLAEAVEEAQDLGMKVVLVGIGAPDSRLGVVSVAEHLALRVDSIITLPNELVEACFSRSVAAAPRISLSDRDPAHEPAFLVDSKPKPAPPSHGRPYPVVPTQGSRRPPSHIVYSSESSGLDHSGVDKSPLEVAWDVGTSVATSWYGSVSQTEVNDLAADRPILPSEVDRVLLKDCAQRIGEQRTDFQEVRRALREAFWQKLDELQL
ncbi:NYN domain-containing protein [Arthrobacter sp. 2YAF22_2]|uniref:NYN domain-containing protein n=1 Tax=Arthrobacter sp. 2YAF22_2 TaxID=3233029 RepID=UPI003F8D9E09